MSLNTESKAGHQFSSSDFKTITSFPQLSFSALNCNSLNISQITSNHQKLKVYSIAKLNTDIVFLSDIRLKKDDPAVKELEKQFLSNPFCSYNFEWHCLKGKRGVGILHKSSLNLTMQVVGSDVDSNWLAATTNLNGMDLLLVAVYGPNEYNHGFFFYAGFMLE